MKPEVRKAQREQAIRLVDDTTNYRNFSKQRVFCGISLSLDISLYLLKKPDQIVISFVEYVHGFFLNDMLTPIPFPE